MIIFSPLNTFMRKGKDPDSDDYTYGCGSGRPKNKQILYGSGSACGSESEKLV
jgi:hypothetical protein